MKRLSKKELIEILNKKDNSTYDELALLTGYHPKSLARISSMIKRNRYDLIDNKRSELNRSIIADYLDSSCKTYKEFYSLNSFKYGVSYSTLCKVLKDAKDKREAVLIKKIKTKGNYFFEIVDFSSESILFTYNSLKNDTKSVKKILYLLIKNYGSPQNISFVNFFPDVPTCIRGLLSKYDINLLDFKSCHRKSFNNLSHEENIKYRSKKIHKEDFYDIIARRTIADNIIQFQNVRYNIETKKIIKRNTKVILYYDNLEKDIFVKFNDKIFELTHFKDIDSKKGTTKY